SRPRDVEKMPPWCKGSRTSGRRSLAMKRWSRLRPPDTGWTDCQFAIDPGRRLRRRECHRQKLLLALEVEFHFKQNSSLGKIRRPANDPVARKAFLPPATVRPRENDRIRRLRIESSRRRLPRTGSDR